MSATVKPQSKPKISPVREAWNNLEIWVCIICMTCMLVLCFAEVIARYVLHRSIAWSEEVAKWFVVWTTFAGSAYAFRRGAHIGVDALVGVLPKSIKTIVQWTTRAATIGFFVFLGWHGYGFCLQVARSGQVAPATRLSMAIPYSAAPIGCLMVVLRLIDTTIREIRLGRPLGVDEA